MDQLTSWEPKAFSRLGEGGHVRWMKGHTLPLAEDHCLGRCSYWSQRFVPSGQQRQDIFPVYIYMWKNNIYIYIYTYSCFNYKNICGMNKKDYPPGIQHLSSSHKKALLSWRNVPFPKGGICLFFGGLHYTNIPGAPMTSFFWRSTSQNKAKLPTKNSRGPRLGSRYIPQKIEPWMNCSACMCLLLQVVPPTQLRHPRHASLIGTSRLHLCVSKDGNAFLFPVKNLTFFFVRKKVWMMIYWWGWCLIDCSRGTCFFSVSFENFWKLWLGF